MSCGDGGSLSWSWQGNFIQNNNRIGSCFDLRPGFWWLVPIHKRQRRLYKSQRPKRRSRRYWHSYKEYKKFSKVDRKALSNSRLARWWVSSRLISVGPRILCKNCVGISVLVIEAINKGDKSIPIVLETISRVIVTETGIGIPPPRVCYAHRKRLAATAGFQVKQPTSDALEGRLRAYLILWTSPSSRPHATHGHGLDWLIGPYDRLTA